MESIRHPNIVLFMGSCTKLPHLSIVLEFCPYKSLWNLLHNKKISLSWEKRRRIALGVAQGMNYLHSFPIPVLHRDLKSLNILIDEGLIPKIADFGWTRLKSKKMTKKIGTFQWMAPEVLTSQDYTEKADVFSYGIILWEIASRKPPYKNISGITVATRVVSNNLRPPIDDSYPKPFSELMAKCWDRNPENRPRFKEIIHILNSMKFSNS